MYTIAYRVQYTCTRVHARIPNGHPREDPREENRACRTSRRGSSCVFSARGERSYSCAASREVAGHADILPTILAWKSTKMFVSVSVSAPWNASLIELIQNMNNVHTAHRRTRESVRGVNVA